MMLTNLMKKINNEFSYERRGSTEDDTLNAFKIHEGNIFENQKFTSLSDRRNINFSHNEELKIRREEEKICRICRLNSLRTEEPLISPCWCKGTSAYIHRSCLEKWLRRSGTTYCELCRFNYKIKIIQRESKIYSIKKWLTDDENFNDIQDLTVDLILTITFLPIILFCSYMLVNFYFHSSGTNGQYNILKTSYEVNQKLWMIFVLSCSTIILVVCYSAWIFFRLNHYHRKWSSYVQRHGKLVLILDNKKK